LEQLCINYTNEKLHSVFLNEVFSLEKQLYQKEGLDLATVGVHFQVRTICNTTTPLVHRWYHAAYRSQSECF
jgi:myosin heavy subunit